MNQVYTLRTEHLELSVVPALGANIVSLRSVPSGREWIWHSPDGPGSLTGAAECIPTIAPCTVNGRALPDHGEAWTPAWEVDEEAFEKGSITTSVRLPISGLELTRSIRLDDGVALFEYRVVNTASEPTPYLWAFHPLFVIETGDRVELPESIRSVRQGVSQGYPELASAAVWNWPEPLPGLRLDVIDSARRPASYAKLFADFSQTTEGWAALCRGNERVELRFDPGVIPHLGLWFTNGGWHGFHHMAIEPTTHMTDSLVDAAADPLAPAGERRWHFQIVMSRKEL